MALNAKQRNREADDLPHEAAPPTAPRSEEPTAARNVENERNSPVGRIADEQPNRAPQDPPEDRAREDRDRQDPPRKTDPDAKEKAPRGRFLQEHKSTVLIGALALTVLVAGGLLYWDYTRHFQSTDDAFIAARQYAVAPKVSGYIKTVPVTDNQHVSVGDVIATIDPRDYNIALDQARAQVSSAEASVKNLDSQLEVQQSQIDASKAQVDQAEAGLTFANQQATRYQDLAKTGSGTVQNEQQYTSQQQQAKASLASAQANYKVAQRTLDSLKAQRESAIASLAQAQAQRDQAQLNLSYTTVTAAQAGRVTNLTAAVGQFSQAGAALTMFVPDEIWINANYKETQLDAMRPGQPVTLRIDAYPGRAIDGHVDSVQSGSGTAFSLLPAENATGNYVKIVQRVPVKIVMDNVPREVALGPGMSVVPTVRVNAKPSVYERLRGLL
jgi:membrane fusion protein, multidrug efflux system